ncbi:TraB/GumN family protein [Fulvivirga sp. M361]|uniref:TraB/GumN family protein n=1 Tax=Fulvivirga sp. M361 TaxID=2594266 RepID=UPI001627CD22|nr:TraB/GumN family protein [Fulvivirga sp. M361]
MRKVSLTLFFIYFSAVVGLSQATSDNSVLWKVSGNGLSEPSYLFGIINFLPASGFSIPPEVEAAMEQCKVFATKNLLNKTSKKRFSDAVKIPNNGWINDYLSDDELNQLRLLLLLDYEVKEHVYHDYYSRLQPIILVTSTAALHLGDDIVYTEELLSDMARKYRMKNEELGSIEEEIEAFKQFPIDDQVNALKYTVNNFYEHLADFDAMVKAYLEEQDLKKVKDETFKATNESKSFKKVYYDARVIKWAPKIEGLMKNKATFLSLGVPYLVGDEGLISLLRTKGYTVSAMPATFPKKKL